MTTRTSTPFALALAAAVLLVVTACGQAGPTASTTSPEASLAASPLASTLASATSATGTLLCTPSADQTAACAGLFAGDACTLTSPDGATTRPGTCRASLDGSTVACAPNPPAPPQALVDACNGLALGATCTATEPDGEIHQGVCVTARDGSTEICGRPHDPPQAAIDACTSLTAGATCAMVGRDGTSTVAGICSLGPAGTGVLACAPPHELRPSATRACAGLAVGDPCTIGSDRHPVTGACVSPGQSGITVCQVGCSAAGGPFRCGPGPAPAPPPVAVEACAALKLGDTCSMTRPGGTTTVSGVCRAGPGGTGVLACAPPLPPMPPMGPPHH
jgi:hypothetical protein